MRRHPRQPHADRTAGMTVTRSALSSRSLHECDDGAERIILMRGGMWVRAMPVEQLAEVRSFHESEASRQKFHVSDVSRTVEERGPDSRHQFHRRKTIPPTFCLQPRVLYRTVWCCRARVVRAGCSCAMVFEYEVGGTVLLDSVRPNCPTKTIPPARHAGGQAAEPARQMLTKTDCS